MSVGESNFRDLKGFGKTVPARRVETVENPAFAEKTAPGGKFYQAVIHEQGSWEKMSNRIKSFPTGVKVGNTLEGGCLSKLKSRNCPSSGSDISSEMKVNFSVCKAGKKSSLFGGQCAIRGELTIRKRKWKPRRVWS